MNEAASKRVLRAILRDNADYQFVQSCEEERADELESIRDMPEFTDDDKLNLDAVVREYRDGSLRCPPAGKGVVYFGGVRKTSQAVDIISFPIVEMVEEWIAAGETGRTWTERVRSPN